MKRLLLPLFMLSTVAYAQQADLTAYQCHKGLKTSSATTSAPCYHEAQSEITSFLMQNGEPKWIYATCFAVAEQVTPSQDKIEKAKASFKKNVGTFQNNEIQFYNFYFSTQPEIETNQKLRTDYGLDFEKKVLNSKHVVKVQTASVKAADGNVICKTHLQIINK